MVQTTKKLNARNYFFVFPFIKSVDKKKNISLQKEIMLHLFGSSKIRSCTIFKKFLISYESRWLFICFSHSGNSRTLRNIRKGILGIDPILSLFVPFEERKDPKKEQKVHPSFIKDKCETIPSKKSLTPRYCITYFVT